MKTLKFMFVVLLVVLPINSYGHGISSATAKVAKRPGGLIEVELQYNLIDLLNHRSHDYSLPVVASLSEEKFGLLYDEVLKLFKRDFLIQKGEKVVRMNVRFPTRKQMFDLVKSEFIELKLNRGKQNSLYTFSDRRFYQKAYFDFRITGEQDLDSLSMKFPKQLGAVYVTYTESKNSQLSPGETWSYPG